MTNRTVTLLLGALSVSLFLTQPLSAEEGPQNAKYGRKIDAVTLKDGSGKAVPVPDLKDKKAAVVLFLSFECPVSNSYAAELAQLAKDYGERGVSFVGICNDDSSAAQIAKQGQDFKIPFPVLKDERHAAADHFKAELTPEAFVLDSHGIARTVAESITATPLGSRRTPRPRATICVSPSTNCSPANR